MATFHFNNIREALTEGSQERITPAFNFSTVLESLKAHTHARNEVNNVNALEEQSEHNAEEAAYIASLGLSDEELQQYINNPAQFMKKLAKKERRFKRNTRRAAKLVESMKRMHINANRHNRAAGPRITNDSNRGSPRHPIPEGRRNGGTRRRTRRSRKSRKSRK